MCNAKENIPVTFSYLFLILPFALNSILSRGVGGCTLPPSSLIFVTPVSSSVRLNWPCPLLVRLSFWGLVEKEKPFVMTLHDTWEMSSPWTHSQKYFIKKNICVREAAAARRRGGVFFTLFRDFRDLIPICFFHLPKIVYKLSILIFFFFL